MSLTSTTTLISYDYQAGTNYSLPFSYDSVSDVMAYYVSAGQVIEISQEDFTINNNLATINIALPEGAVITFYRNTPRQQNTSLPPNVLTQAIEKALDRNAMTMQELNARSVKIVASGFDPSLPKVIIPSASLKVNAAGTGLEYGADPDTVMEQVEEATEQAIAAGQHAADAGNAQVAAELAETNAKASETICKSYEVGVEQITFTAGNWTLANGKYTQVIPKTAFQICVGVDGADGGRKICDITSTDTSVTLTSLDAFAGTCYLTTFNSVAGYIAAIATHNVTADAHGALFEAVRNYTDTKIADLIASSPGTLDTLNELAAALGDDPNFAATITTLIGTKVDKVTGKGLSTNDYTNDEKTKLAGIADGANNYSHPIGDGNLHVPATGTANSGKVLIAGETAGSAAWTALTKAMVGLGNADNTSDADKPISTATQNALNAINSNIASNTSRIVLLEKQAPVYGGKFTLAASAATRLYDAYGMSFTKATDTSEGVDDFANVSPFNVYRVIVKPDGNGIAQIAAYEGTVAFDTLLAAKDGDVFTIIPLFYYKRIRLLDGSEIWLISPNALEGFAPSPMHYRNGKLYKYVGISSYQLGDNGTTAQSAPGLPIKVNTTWAGFNTLMRAKGLYVMDYAAACSLQMLGSIKYGNLNWQTVLGSGLSSTYSGEGTTAAEQAVISEATVNRIVVANAAAAKFSVGCYATLIGLTFSQRKVTAIDVYDASNMAITLDGPAFTTTALSTGIRRAPDATGGADSVKGLCGAPAGTDGKVAVKSLGIENLFGNAWDLLGGAFRYCNTVTPVDELYVNNNVIGITSWPATTAAALAAGWSKMNGALPSANGYIQTLNYDKDLPWVTMTKTIGGTSSYPNGDYYATSMSTNQFIVLLGGYLGNGTSAGPFYAFVGNGLTGSSWGFGAFGLYLPAD